ncbi:MAG: IPT/TIG domain-containing protein [Verrucomicrobiota bacterium]
MSKAKLLLLPLLALAALLTGCGPTITNLTSNPVPQNPSGIYEISMTVENMDNSLVKGSYQPAVVIDGQPQPMQESDLGSGIFKYNYLMPEGRSEAKYYFLLDYQTDFKGSIKDKQLQSEEMYDLRITNRYVITLESYRGPVGSTIPVVGRGFSKFDKVVIGGFEADTTYFSPTSLAFIVPPLPAGDSYRVELASGDAVLPVGSFQVDAARLYVNPTNLALAPGERYILVFGIDFLAPAGGVVIDITTDIPQSIIMPEVVIPEGAKSVSVPMEGGIPGTGTLFVEAPGFNALTVPVSVLGSTAVEVNTIEAVDVIEPAGETVIVEEEDVLIVE